MYTHLYGKLAHQSVTVKRGATADNGSNGGQATVRGPTVAERAYEFRRRLEVVHQPDRRDPTAQPGDQEVVIGANWSIVISEQAGALLYGVAFVARPRQGRAAQVA